MGHLIPATGLNERGDYFSSGDSHATHTFSGAVLMCGFTSFAQRMTIGPATAAAFQPPAAVARCGRDDRGRATIDERRSQSKAAEAWVDLQSQIR